MLKTDLAGADASSMVMLRSDVDSWRRQALCAGHPDRGAWFSEDREDMKRAKAVCRACPVRDECLTFAVTTGPHHGIWGGTTPYERRRLRRMSVQAS